MTYEYDFVRLSRKGKEFSRNGTEYQELIRARANEGWRLVTIHAPGDEFGTPRYMDLVFERPQGPMSRVGSQEASVG